MRQRLQKIISGQGIASRRAAEQLIADGKVFVNGRTANIGDSADSNIDIITVNGTKITGTKSAKRYLMLNKPRGYVTTMSDEKGRKIVTELLLDVEERVYPVGRLDMRSGNENYKFYENNKTIISSQGVEWLCKNVFKHKYLEMLEDYKMNVTDQFVRAGYYYDNYF